MAKLVFVKEAGIQVGGEEEEAGEVRSQRLQDEELVEDVGADAASVSHGSYARAREMRK